MAQGWQHFQAQYGWLACVCAIHLMPDLLISYQWLLQVFPLHVLCVRLSVYVCVWNQCSDIGNT